MTDALPPYPPNLDKLRQRQIAIARNFNLETKEIQPKTATKYNQIKQPTDI